MPVFQLLVESLGVEWGAGGGTPNRRHPHHLALVSRGARSGGEVGEKKL